MNYKHGCTTIDDRSQDNPEWKAHYTWLGMKSRCTNKKNKMYPDYGGWGITFDPAWSDFRVFLKDMGLPPGSEFTIGRVDNDGPYCKTNCQWETRTEQNRNRRNNRYLEFNGERLGIPEWAERLGVKQRLIRVRLHRGWSVAETLSRPCA